MKEEKSVYELVIEIANHAQQMEEAARNKELYEKKDEPIKKINEIKPHKNYSLEAYNHFMQQKKDVGNE